jgi:YhcH/YjgK/YiaL family protein
MKITNIFIYSTLIITMMACQNKRDVSEWSDTEINDWFSASPWSTELGITPDASIDKRQFVEQNVLNPSSWEAAFTFLKEQDLNTLELGRHELSDDGTFVNIEEYTTKDSAHFEAHRAYIDIQYLAKGKEYIHVTPYEPEKQSEVQAYDETKDIEFFDKEEYTPRLLSPENFMVFFPSDGHKPCMKVDTNEAVRKVVVKIPYIIG